MTDRQALILGVLGVTMFGLTLPAAHGAVVLAVLPLLTAMGGALVASAALLGEKVGWLEVGLHCS
jgi:hypothetical protein